MKVVDNKNLVSNQITSIKSEFSRTGIKEGADILFTKYLIETGVHQRVRIKCSSQYLSFLNFNLFLLKSINIVIAVFMFYLIIIFSLYPTHLTLPHPFNSTSLIQLFPTHPTRPHTSNFTPLIQLNLNYPILPHPFHSTPLTTLCATHPIICYPI